MWGIASQPNRRDSETLFSNYFFSYIFFYFQSSSPIGELKLWLASQRFRVHIPPTFFCLLRDLFPHKLTVTRKPLGSSCSGLVGPPSLGLDWGDCPTSFIFGLPHISVINFFLHDVPHSKWDLFRARDLLDQCMEICYHKFSRQKEKPSIYRQKLMQFISSMLSKSYFRNLNREPLAPLFKVQFHPVSHCFSRKSFSVARGFFVSSTFVVSADF